MNTTNRYWNYKKTQTSEPLAPLLRNSSEPFHKVTHRAIGDIPGCVSAPREHTFKDRSPEEMRALVVSRADVYSKAVQAYLKGEYGGENGLVEMWAAIDRAPPVFDPFGKVVRG